MIDINELQQGFLEFFRILSQYNRPIDEKEYFATESTVQLSALQVIDI